MTAQSCNNHTLYVENRNNIKITGVTEVINSCKSEVVLNTSFGMLTVKGSDLSIETLDVTNGDLAFKGNICSMFYKPESKLSGGFKRLFR